MHRLMPFVGTLAAINPIAFAQLDFGDMILGRGPDNRILLGRLEDGSPAPEFPWRVFVGEFGPTPNFTNEPGYDSEPGTFSGGTRLTFSIRKALREWDGYDFEAIADERLRVNFGPLGPVFTPLTDVLTPGFAVSVTAGGEFHHHYGYLLESPAEPGIYLVEFEMGGDRGLLTSDPYWLVLEQGGSGHDRDEAVRWVIDNLARCRADVSGSSDPSSPGYGAPDGVVDAADFFFYLDQFAAGNLLVADLSGSSDPNDPAYGVPDGVVDSADFFYYLDQFAAGCG